MARQRRHRRKFGKVEARRYKDGTKYYDASYPTPSWAFSKWSELDLPTR